MNSSMGYIGVLVGLVMLPWVAMWSPDDGARPVRVLVAPELAARVEVVEWMGRPIDHRVHPDGTVEYFGQSGPIPSPGERGELTHGDAGVKITGFYRRPHRVAIWEHVPRRHELVVRLKPDEAPEVLTRPAR